MRKLKSPHSAGRRNAVELVLDLHGVVLDRETQPFRQPADVRVDRQTGKTERHAAHDVAGLATHAGKSDQIVERGRYLTFEPLEQCVGHTDQVPRLVLVEPRRANQFLDLGGVCRSEPSSRSDTGGTAQASPC